MAAAIAVSCSLLIIMLWPPRCSKRFIYIIPKQNSTCKQWHQWGYGEWGYGEWGYREWGYPGSLSTAATYAAGAESNILRRCELIHRCN